MSVTRERRTDWTDRTPTSRRWFERARALIPEGSSSPVRAGRVFDPYPFFVDHAEGAYLFDVDGNRYLDTLMGFGPVILGHAHPAVTEAVAGQAAKGLIYGASTPLEVQVAETIVDMVPSADLVRFAPSGTEATMHAIRVARGFTGKPGILKFEGHYHGNHDQVLVSVNTSLEEGGPASNPVKVPVGTGIPVEHQAHTTVAVWNDLEAVERLIRANRHTLAAVITEPIMANKGFIPPADGYLRGLQRVCRENDVLFALDEVITGFRLARGGAQEVFGLEPDLSTFAKAVANGAPMALFTGRREVMAVLEGGRVRHAGTYNASPICLAAARATLAELNKDDGAVYGRLEATGSALRAGLQEIMDRHGVPARVQGMGSMLQAFFTDLPKVGTYREALRSDLALFSRFAHQMIRRGVFVHPDGFEHWFVSAAHGEREVGLILDSADDSIAAARASS